MADEDATPGNANDDGESSPGTSALDHEIFHDGYDRMVAERDKEDNAYAEYARRTTYAEDVRTAYKTYNDTENFEPGQLVQWKKLMRNRRFPVYGAPAVVISNIEDPIAIDRDGDRIAEPEDVILGFLDGDQALLVFPFSRRRFTVWE